MDDDLSTSLAARKRARMGLIRSRAAHLVSVGIKGRHLRTHEEREASARRKGWRPPWEPAFAMDAHDEDFIEAATGQE